MTKTLKKTKLKKLKMKLEKKILDKNEKLSKLYHTNNEWENVLNEKKTD